MAPRRKTTRRPPAPAAQANRRSGQDAPEIPDDLPEGDDEDDLEEDRRAGTTAEERILARMTSNVERRAKARGVRVVYWARSLGGRYGTTQAATAGPELQVRDGRGELVTIRGEQPGSMVMGCPPVELLLRNDVDIRAPRLRTPWPGSVADRNLEPVWKEWEPPPGYNRPRPGPGYWERMHELGLWPDDRELGWMEYQARKIEDHKRVGRALYMQQGYHGSKLRELVAKIGQRPLSGRAPDIDRALEAMDERDEELRLAQGADVLRHSGRGA